MSILSFFRVVLLFRFPLKNGTKCSTHLNFLFLFFFHRSNRKWSSDPLEGELFSVSVLNSFYCQNDFERGTPTPNDKVKNSV